MPDTAIIKTNDGWIDRDAPQVFYPVRRLAREARRSSHPRTIKNAKPFKSRFTSTPATTIAAPVDGLKKKLHARFETYGIAKADADFVIDSFGYNKAASYGHMRAAGANHSEALNVVALDSPEISLAYGKARARGEGHTAAFAEALRDN